MTDTSNPLVAMRQRVGRNQKDIGDIAHVTQQTVSLYEAGGTAPSFSRLRLLAAAYGVTVELLVDALVEVGADEAASG